MRSRRKKAALSLVLGGGVALLLFLLVSRVSHPPPSASGTDSEGISLDGPAPPTLQGVRSNPPVAPADGERGAADESEDVVTSGRIVWPDGEPYTVPECAVSVLVVGEAGGRRHRLFRLSSEGHFSFDAPRGQTCLIELLTEHGPAFRPWKLSAGARDAVLTIPAGPNAPFMALRVEDEAGRAVPDARLQVNVLGDFGAPTEVSFRITDGWGRFQLGVAARRVLIRVHDAVDEYGAPLGAMSVGPLDMGTKPPTLHLPPGRTWTARIVDPDGRGVPDVVVALDPLPPILNWVGDFVPRKASTNADGQVTFRGLGPERYELDVCPPDPWLRPREMHLSPEAAESKFVLVPGVTALVRVLDSDDRPLRQCQVGVRPDERVTAWWTDGDGTVRVGPLASGTKYTLHAIPPRDRTRAGQEERNTSRSAGGPRVVNSLGRPQAALPALLQATVESWVPHDTTIRLERDTEPLPPPAEPGEAGPAEGTGTMRFRVRMPRPDEYGRSLDGELASEGPDGQVSHRVYLFVEYDPGSASYVAEGDVDGVDAGTTYTLRLAGVQDGLALVAKGLKPRAEPYDLALEPGLSIRGRIGLPESTEYVSIDARSGPFRLLGWECGATVFPDGRFEVPGLVPGSWHLDFSIRARQRWYSVEAVVMAGEEVTLTPRPVDQDGR